MTNESDPLTKEHNKKGNHGGDISGGIYGMAFIGAAFYFISHAATFWMGILGVIKALFWPAFLIYKILERMSL
jgi:hypothetical protein